MRILILAALASWARPAAGYEWEGALPQLAPLSDEEWAALLPARDALAVAAPAVGPLWADG